MTMEKSFRFEFFMSGFSTAYLLLLLFFVTEGIRYQDPEIRTVSRTGLGTNVVAYLPGFSRFAMVPVGNQGVFRWVNEWK